MSESTYEAIDDVLLEAVLACRPVQAPLTASVDLGDGLVVWGERSGVGTMTDISQAMWTFLDGTVSLAAIADDLTEAGGIDRQAARQHVGAFGLDLMAAHLADGFDGPAEIVRGRADMFGPGQEIIEYEQVIDGIHYRVSERTLTMGQIKEMTGGLASHIELVDPDSCVGKRMHLDRPGRIVTVELHGELFSARITDKEVADRLAAVDQVVEGKGPIIAIVTDGDAGGGLRRFGVYDKNGVQVASTTSTDAVHTAVTGLLASESAHPHPPGNEVRVRVLVKEDRAVVASLGALERPRGMLRHLGQAGVEVVPTSRAWISDDGATVTVATTPLDRPPGRPSTLTFPVVGLYVAANKPGTVRRSSLAHLLVRDMAPPSFERRQATLDAVAQLVDRVPAHVGFKRKAKALEVARYIIGRFD